MLHTSFGTLQKQHIHSNLIHHFIQILYQQNRQSKTHILERSSTSAELLVPSEDYLTEMKAVSDAGNGTNSEEIGIPKNLK